MSPAKKKKKGPVEPAPLVKLISFLRGRGRPLAAVGLLTAAIAVGCCLVWPVVRDWVLSSRSYIVGPQQVHINQPPDWIHTDIRAEVFLDTSLDWPMSIMDEDLNERIRNAFSLHPWVAKVGEVWKQHPARVQVELVYRRPVCMVEVSGRLYPVDGGGVLLPGGDFSAVEAARYPKLTGVDRVPVGTVGESWGDPVVLDGAGVAEALLPVWQRLKLSRIEPSSVLATGVAEEHFYTLVTRRGTRVLWGRSPSTDAPGELPAAEKVARLRQYAQEHGSLEGRGGPQQLDVHRLQPPRVSWRPTR